MAALRTAFWWVVLISIVLVGILSRLTETGFRVLDKYLGDALYAAMVYVIFRLTGRVTHVAVWTAAAMAAIESFQLTGLAERMFQSEYMLVRLCARLLGTEFGVLDLVAYAAGIVCIAALDRAMRFMESSTNGGV